MVKASRALANLTQTDLAKRAGVSVSALRNFERGVTTLIPATLAALTRALLEAGVEIDLSNGPTLRYRPGQAPAAADAKVLARLANAPRAGD